MEQHGHRPPEEAIVNSQRGRLMVGKTLRDQDGGAAERNADRYANRSRRRRQGKSNAKRQRTHRERMTAIESLQAQILVASGQTSATPAMVENAKKALQRKVDAVMAENPALTEEQAAEAVYSYAAGAR